MRNYDIEARMTSQEPGHVMRGKAEGETPGEAVDRALERFGVAPHEVKDIVIQASGIRIALGNGHDEGEDLAGGE